MWLCTNCWNKVRAGENICRNCGMVFTDDSTNCGSCGSVVSSGDSFCELCGNPVKQAAKQNQTQRITKVQPQTPPQSPSFSPPLSEGIFCMNCGAEVQSDNIFCINCGSRLSAQPAGTEQPQQNAPAQTYDRPGYENDSSSNGFAVLSFFFPVVGLILYLVWRENLPLRARSSGKGAIIGAIVNVVIVIISVIVQIAATNYILRLIFP